MDYPERSLMSVLIWANNKLKEHGLHDWKAVIDTKAKRRLGQCRYMEQVIGISEYHIKSHEMSEVVDTILHEIAHALVGAGHAHGEVWQRMAVRVGAKPTAKAKVSSAADALNKDQVIPCMVICNDAGEFVYTAEISKQKYNAFASRKKNIKNVYLRKYKAYTLGRINVAMIKRSQMVKSVFQ